MQMKQQENGDSNIHVRLNILYFFMIYAIYFLFFILPDFHHFYCFFKNLVFDCLDFSQNCIFLFHIINSWSYFNYLISPSFMLYFSKKKNALIDIVVELLSHVQLFATPWTVAHQTPLFSTVSGK